MLERTTSRLKISLLAATIVVVLVVGLAATGFAGDQERTASAPVDVEARDRSTSGDGAIASALLRDRSEPIFDGDFADPAAVSIGTEVYAYATNTPDANVPVGRAGPGGRSMLDRDALPALPDWSEPGWVWAPAAIEISPGDFRLYYTTRDRRSGRQCVSVAVASEPSGPFADTSSAPLVCQFDLGGSIDPSPVQVDGQTHLLWKSDGNCCGLRTTIYSARLDPTGTVVLGPVIELISNDLEWEGAVVEAPSMVEIDDGFLLFYSGNDWASGSYAIGYAHCDAITGPCHKPSDDPLIATDATRSGPGGAHVFRGAGGGLHLIYHAWIGDAIGYHRGGVRALFVEPLVVDDGRPVPATVRRGAGE